MPPKRPDKAERSKPISDSSQRHDRGETSTAASQRSASSQSVSRSQSMTQADKAAASIDEEELEIKVNDLVQYMLVMWQKNYPVKKLDINKNVLKDPTSKSAFAHIMKKAQEKMSKVFGIDIVELQDKHKGSYVLVNTLDNDSENPHMLWPADDNCKMGLLMVILSLIYMNGNVMQDSEMWHALKKLGIEPEIPHPTFGESKRLITQEFVRQGYLEYIREQNVDPPTYQFKWGQRAQLETSKRNCLSFVSQIYNMDPEKWTSQYQDMVDTEGPWENGEGET